MWELFVGGFGRLRASGAREELLSAAGVESGRREAALVTGGSLLLELWARAVVGASAGLRTNTETACPV